MSQLTKSVNNKRPAVSSETKKAAIVSGLGFGFMLTFTLAWSSIAIALTPSAIKADFDSADTAVKEQKLRNAGYLDGDLEFVIDPENFRAANQHANKFLRENRGDNK